jgi:hypothetical protein
MIGFQILAIGLAVVLILFFLHAIAKRRLSFRAGIFWIGLWGTAAITIARPSLTKTVANYLGIARGADLVFYCSILAGFLAFFGAFLKFRRMEREITQLTRHLALLQSGDGASDSSIEPQRHERQTSELEAAVSEQRG